MSRARRFRFMTYFKEENHQKGTLLVKEGDAAPCMFILLAGRMGMYKKPDSLMLDGEFVPSEAITDVPR